MGSQLHICFHLLDKTLIGVASFVAQRREYAINDVLRQLNDQIPDSTIYPAFLNLPYNYFLKKIYNYYNKFVRGNFNPSSLCKEGYAMLSNATFTKFSR